jgi:hypothetical protein
MSTSFAGHARKLAGIASALAGWSPDIFWRATPAELAAVLDALTAGEADAAPPSPDLIAALKELHPDG